mmetsp:Transcript_2585/g.4673  ORF Transcript_2585/g.4673 Transcript_2585/m.4673 type:complete len:270 (-) Transcript_2585:2117-2926(-)
MASFFLPIDDDEGRSTPTQPQFPAPTRTPSRHVSVDLGRELKKKRLQERRKAAEARRNKRIKDQTEKLRLRHLKVDVIRDLKLHSSPVFAPTPSSPTSRGSAKTTTPTTSDYTSSNMFSSPEKKGKIPPRISFQEGARLRLLLPHSCPLRPALPLPLDRARPAPSCFHRQAPRGRLRARRGHQDPQVPQGQREDSACQGGLRENQGRQEGAAIHAQVQRRPGGSRLPGFETGPGALRREVPALHGRGDENERVLNARVGQIRRRGPRES